jgi:WD40 repeat protein
MWIWDVHVPQLHTDVTLVGLLLAGYAEAGTFCEFKDAGMSAAWNASGTCFAAASQDGKVCVWDPRGKRVCVCFACIYSFVLLIRRVGGA